MKLNDEDINKYNEFVNKTLEIKEIIKKEKDDLAEKYNLGQYCIARKEVDAFKSKAELVNLVCIVNSFTIIILITGIIFSIYILKLNHCFKYTTQLVKLIILAMILTTTNVYLFFKVNKYKKILKKLILMR